MTIQSENNDRKYRIVYLLWLLIFLFTGANSYSSTPAPAKTKPVPPVVFGKDGRLSYASDSLGNRVPDFSYCGYLASEQPIPAVPVKVTVPAMDGDATLRIQAALDYVALLPADQNGFRGAVLLGKGTHSVKGALKISASGVVLRGYGPGEEGTVVLAAGKERRTLITVCGVNDRNLSSEVKITDRYVPVNGFTFRVEFPDRFKTGEQVRIHRPSTSEWINKLGCNHFGGGITALGWKPGQQDIFWDRRIVSVQNGAITLDAPITTALDSAYGGGLISSYEWPGRINRTGIENLLLRSEWDTGNPKDEDHCWMAVTFNNCCDGWVRQVTFEHFAGSAVSIFENGSRITVEDCKSLAPVSEIGGQRRNTFFTSGQQTLFQRCYAEYGYHDYAVGSCAAGPNAFLQCESLLPFSFSGTVGSWASGVLFDIVNIDGQPLSYLNRGQEGQGAGWSAANSVLWQCTAARLDCFAPPTAQNWAFGTWGQFSGDGYWNDSNNQIHPRSLFYGQLADRLGKDTDARARLFPMETEASSSPSAETAAKLTAQASEPRMELTKWIDQASLQNPFTIQWEGIKTIDQIGIKKPLSPPLAPPMSIKNGWLARGEKVLTGRKHSVPWWNKNPIPAVTRFVPGRVGKNATDDLEEVTDWMVKEHIIALEQNYGLWYDRRRDDHERIRRMDGDVWPPFYELPFARSGKETAWDGLSKYDLTKYNHWYWSRLKQFADLADQKGLVLVHQNYFQHNIIEAGAHWADFPWRPVNNINNTGFPEPVPYAGDKRIFMADQFYDVTHPVRRGLNEAYIRKCMENFTGNNGVIQYIGEEFTGPFHFVRFWLETVQQWKNETGEDPVIGLAVTKDVQDSILNDPNLASLIDLIDIRYWFYRTDGSPYSPKGGLSLAPRQHARLVKPGKSSFEQVYRAIREYHDRFPGKAVTYSADSYDSFGWAVFIAGGSLALLPSGLMPGFLESASTMAVKTEDKNGQYQLQNKNGESIIYCKKGTTAVFDGRSFKGRFHIFRMNPSDGKTIGKQMTISAGKLITLPAAGEQDSVYWIIKI